MQWRMEELGVRLALHVPDSPDCILGKGRISTNAMEMELQTPVPGSRARGNGILNTWLPASKGDNGEWRDSRCLEGIPAPMLLLTRGFGLRQWTMEKDLPDAVPAPWAGA